MDMNSAHNDYNSATMISSPSFQGRSFNKRLDPNHIDISPDDNSCGAVVTRGITGFVSRVLRPRQVIVILRLLKALTFCTLCLTIIADIMFIFFVELSVSTDVSIKLGGFRDRVNRVYGVGLAILAVLVELDMQVVNDHFVGLKPFLVRSFLLLFVASLSASSPMIGYERRQYRQYFRYNKNNNNNYNRYNNYNYNDDDGDDDNDGNDDYMSANFSYMIKDEVPGSAVAFQSITSFILLGCACAYFLLGCMCLDRFTARAFLADDDQVAAAVTATAIRQNPAQQQPIHMQQRDNSFDSYNGGGNDRYNHNNHGTYSPNRVYAPDRSYA